MNSKQNRAFESRSRILSVAAALFTEHGYPSTSIEMVLSACTISRGALYHHFRSKEALFVAVLEATEAKVAAVMREAARGNDDPAVALQRSCDTWLDSVQDPEVRQIVLIDAAGVVGWAQWRAINQRHTLGLLEDRFVVAAGSGRIRPELVSINAHLILAMLVEVALFVSRSDQAALELKRARRSVALVIERLIDGG